MYTWASGGRSTTQQLAKQLEQYDRTSKVGAGVPPKEWIIAATSRWFTKTDRRPLPQPLRRGSGTANIYFDKDVSEFRAMNVVRVGMLKNSSLFNPLQRPDGSNVVTC